MQQDNNATLFEHVAKNNDDDKTVEAKRLFYQLLELRDFRTSRDPTQREAWRTWDKSLKDIHPILYRNLHGALKKQADSHESILSRLQDAVGDSPALKDPRGVGGDRKTMDWKDIETKVYDAGYGKFLEMALRTNGVTTGLAISAGEYARTKDGGSDKEKPYYKARVFVNLNSETKEWLQATLKELLAKL